MSRVFLHQQKLNNTINISSQYSQNNNKKHHSTASKKLKKHLPRERKKVSEINGALYCLNAAFLHPDFYTKSAYLGLLYFLLKYDI